jgi:lactobin A/cerein 7B family class IIb bacteriocin
MNTLKLNDANLVELTNDELVEIDGGLAGLIIIGIIILLTPAALH